MRRTTCHLDESTVVFECGIPFPGDTTLVERKGWGHPDTLADHLAERLSRAYSRYTLSVFGAILHHNFDKLTLLGGASEVRYRSGRMLAPVRVLVNGRAAWACGDDRVPVDELAVDTIRAFFHQRLPELGKHIKIELNVTTNPSPGAVHGIGDRPPERTLWFRPRSIDDLRERRTRLANDTSLGTGWAPENSVERFARILVDHLASPGNFTSIHPWCGSDVKLMSYAGDEEADMILCVPQKSRFVGSRTEYLNNCEEILAECRVQASRQLADFPIRFHLNMRDVPERDELYLTLTGSSIESGDEGVVGRGNRVNGLITPLRPMTIEASCGKNPAYHVGKLYNVAAQRLATRLYAATGEYAEVYLMSATGQRLDRPWRVLVRLAANDVPLQRVRALVLEVLDSFPALTEEIVADGLTLS